MKRTWLTVALALATCAVQAQEWRDEEDPRAQAAAEAHEAYLARVSGAVAAGGTPRALAFAALLRKSVRTPNAAVAPAGGGPSTRSPGDPQIDAWVRAAAARAGDDVMANQLLVAVVDDASSPQRVDAARRWLAAEPDNLAAQLAQRAPAERMLVQAATARRADDHHYDTVRWMVSVLSRHPMTAQERARIAAPDDEAPSAREQAALLASALVLATTGFDTQSLMQACQGRALRTTTSRRDECRHVAGLLSDASGSALDNSIGLSLQAALADDAAARAEVAARRQRMDWQMFQWGQTSARQPNGGIGELVRLLDDPAIRTERQLRERVLQDAGVSLVPPPDWVSPWRR